MALDWLPIDARPFVQPPTPRSDLVTAFTPVTNPPPDILANLTFWPIDAWPARPPSGFPVSSMVEPFPLEALAPLAFLPTDARPARPPSTARSDQVEPPPGALIVIAQSLAWLPTDAYPHNPAPRAGETYEILEPTIIASALTCIELADDDFSATTIINESVTATGIIDEDFSATTIIDEEVC